MRTAGAGAGAAARRWRRPEIRGGGGAVPLSACCRRGPRAMMSRGIGWSAQTDRRVHASVRVMQANEPCRYDSASHAILQSYASVASGRATALLRRELPGFMSREEPFAECDGCLVHRYIPLMKVPERL